MDRSTSRCVRLFVLVVLIAAASIPAAAQAPQTMTPEAALARVLQNPVQADWFDPSFLVQVPVAQVDKIVKQYVGSLGSFERIEPSGDRYTVVMERGSFPARIVLNAAGEITGLWFGAQELKTSGLGETLKQLAKLPGKVSAVVIEDGKPRGSLTPDAPLAIGSAFKLAILAALEEQIAAGKHRLDEVQTLRPSWKSLPTGVLRQWPDGTPLTIATLANEMISISDNTAADALIGIVGRENVEKFAPRNKPFLTTREAFVLKASANSALLARYRAADEKARRAMLDEIDRQPLPDAKQFTQPSALDIEWFFATSELCTLIGRVSSDPALHINPGLADPEDWKQIAFKGGSEGGVLNLTTRVTGKDGKQFCVSATWNNTADLDETRFFALYRAILSGLVDRDRK